MIKSAVGVYVYMRKSHSRDCWNINLHFMGAVSDGPNETSPSYKELGHLK
jgi:hypothetical protein